MFGLVVISLRLPRHSPPHKGLVKLAGNIFFSPVLSLTPTNQPSSCALKTKTKKPKSINVDSDDDSRNGVLFF